MVDPGNGSSDKRKGHLAKYGLSGVVLCCDITDIC